MASKEKIKKKKTKAPSPSVHRKSKSSNVQVEIENKTNEELSEDVRGSQVSVRSANDENIKDFTQQDPQFMSPVPQGSATEPQTSISETRKSKKDHVEQKLGHGGNTAKNPSKPILKKTEPMPLTGSAVSLRSNISRGSKEAWIERNEQDVQESTNTSKKVQGSSTFKLSRVNKVAPEDTSASASNTRTGSTVVDFQRSRKTSHDGFRGVKVEVQEDSPEKHAYVPYLYARNCISKIMEDMKAMKQTHVVIVESIQTHYGEIETETQEQFNMFVLCIREEYANKQSTFRQVIDTHQVELDKKEKYWNEMLQSLAERNNRLLREKKMLLVHNKTEIEKMEKEKGELQQQLGVVVAPVPVSEAWEEERKLLHDELETEKMNIQHLQQQLTNANTGSGTPIKLEMAKPSMKENATPATVGFGAGALATAGVMAATKENNKQIEKERHEIEDERNKLSEERTKFDMERESFGEDQEKWMNEINRLQTELAEKSVSGNEWKVKHGILHGRLEEVAGVQAKHQTLESQYAALALLVKGSDTSAQLKENLEKTRDEKKMMHEEKLKLDTQINKWEKDFERKNGRKPTDEDKAVTDSVQEMYTTQEEVMYMVTSLQTKENTLRQVESGTVPEAPQIPHTPVDLRDPEVVTVQVKVPDPTIVEELQQSQSAIITVRSEVTTLQQEISNLRAEVSRQNEQLSGQRESIAELEHQIAVMKAEGVVAGAGIAGTAGISEEELAAMKNENRELRRDMKKMIKQYERLSERQQSGGTDGNANMTEMAEAMGRLDNKLADLEAENEALKEERLILREKVRTITETITITHFEDNKKSMEEKEKKIDEQLSEITNLRGENVSMVKDMKKMVKTHAKTKGKLDELMSAEKAVKLLEIVAMMVHEIHGEVPDAAGKVNVRLDDAHDDVSQSKQLLDNKQAVYQAWVDTYQKAHGKIPGKEDRDKNGEKFHGEWDLARKDFKEKHLFMSALLLMKSGDVNEAVGKDGAADMKGEIEIANLEKALSTADNQIIDLEAQAQNLADERNRYKEKVEDLEKMLMDMQKQAELNATLMADAPSSADLTEQMSELQKKADSFEADLMQEKMSHVNTRDELDTLRKQIDVLKEESENEKQGMEARLNGAKAGLAAQLEVKEEELTSVKGRNEELEAEKLSKLPPDAAAEIKILQDKLRKIDQDRSSNKTSSVALSAEVAEMTSQLDVATKNLETQRAANREIEAKLKAHRHAKDKDTKKMSRQLEEKQQKTASEDKQRIAMLVKRIKELESKAGKGTNILPVPGGVGGSDKHGSAEILMLKRENKDKAADIKRLEKEIKIAGGVVGKGGESATDKKKMAQHEKILKELEKRMEFEKDKSGKVMDGLKAADEENKSLQKELEEKNRILGRLTGEMKTISMAAKEGIEAASRVKELEGETKKLGEENIILTKNFESERVLRKKYYNMVEDMKGKIRVYCRARPMSKTEMDKGNKPVCRSSDEYSISVDATRGLKEFQFDQVFMENSSQEKIFEDTNNLIQSAVDGYNVCIFAYGQTGSGKTYTMIGDRDQKSPGIAPRAFTRIFQLADELKNKFTITIETYMLELYNDRLIDLFVKTGTEDEKLDIKKDKKGMVYVQGSVVKKARNAKELFALFEQGSANRHTASTKMNAESSRSHLVLGIIMEATNKNSGSVTKGKLSLVDLAGSERVGKTGAGAEQLKEAMSINKSLSALGDVISALSSDQQFIPYRNNKLTMLMQDSLGGNAKTLMFVNISPVDYNMEESVISLTYASRVKLITNDASKMADNKEIARLRNIIEKMKQGESVQEEDYA